MSEASILALHVAGVRAARINLVASGQIDLAKVREQLQSIGDILAKVRWHLQLACSTETITPVGNMLSDLPVPTP